MLVYKRMFCPIILQICGKPAKRSNPDGTVTVTKLAGMAILGAGATIINSLFSSDA
jgi:hypothetical protein